jgi:hypothetical protein
MASTRLPTLRLRPLAKRGMAELAARANRLGISPADYARKLVERGLALERKAERSSFASIMAPVRKAAGIVSESEIIKLVNETRPHK